jgi:putative nucleotidyltransferase with HDIG domain
MMSQGKPAKNRWLFHARSDGREPSTLLVLTGLFQGSEHRIVSRFSIGRDPKNDLHLADKEVSRFHAAIEPTSEGYLLKDLGSRNGTQLNDKKVDNVLLNEGDEIRVGRILMRFRLGTASGRKRPEGSTAISLPSETLARVRYRSSAEGALSMSLVPPDHVGPLSEHLSKLQALYQMNIILNSKTDQEGIFHRTLEQLLHALSADRGVILLLDPLTRELKTRYSLLRTGSPVPQDILASRAIVHEVLQKGMGLLIEDALADARFNLSESVQTLDIRSALCVPLVHRGETLGMIYLDTMGGSFAFKEEDLGLVTAMAVPAAVQIRNLRYLEQLSKAYLDTMKVLVNSIEARDHYTVGHAWRVTRIALAMVDELNWSQEQKRYTEMGGILHDIGKIAVEDAVLRKTGPLTPEEFQKMRLHPEHGARILKDVEFLKPVIPFVLFHQERWDGQGYPFQLKGEDLPVEGRLLAVGDAFDAMTSHRPYRETLLPERAVDELRKNSGTQFDPQMVDVFVHVWERGKIASILQDYALGGRSIPCPFCSTHIPVGEKPREGVILECPVCSKNCVISGKAGEWRGELA